MVSRVLQPHTHTHTQRGEGEEGRVSIREFEKGMDDGRGGEGDATYYE